MAEEDTKATREHARLRGQSGNVNSDDPLVCFLYLLLREGLPFGTIEGIMSDLSKVDGTKEFTNGWAADHAKDIARRLRRF